MIIGPIMIGAGIYGLCEIAGKEVVARVRKKKHKEDKPLTITEQYTQLFENLGLMSTKKGDWIKCYGVEEKEFYSRVKFTISDTLSIGTFKKAAETLREKLKVINFEVYEEKGYMYFRSRCENLPVIPYKFRKTPKHLIPLGLDLDQEVVYWDIKKDPHQMLVGASNSGKSNELNTEIDHIVHNIVNPKLFLIDLKFGLEFGVYKSMRNVVAYAQELKDAPKVLQAFEDEADNRYRKLSEEGYREYNKYIADKPNCSMRRAFLIIDEFVDLMKLSGGKDGYDAMDVLVNLSRKCRAVGMHIILAAQRATVDSLNPSVKANISCILGMKTVNEHNSRLIIDGPGLEILKIGECIGVVGSEKKFFKGFYIEDETIEATVKEFEKVESVPQKQTASNPLKVVK